MDCFDFLERVEGALLWHEYQVDETLNNFAWFTANQMMSTGNMKKGADALKLKKNLYQSMEDLAEDKHAEERKATDVQAEKEKLMQRFDL